MLRDGSLAGAVVQLVHGPAGVSADVLAPAAAEASTLAELRAVGEALRVRGLLPRAASRRRAGQSTEDEASNRTAAGGLARVSSPVHD